jgi:protein-disulfide isomerase
MTRSMSDIAVTVIAIAAVGMTGMAALRLVRRSTTHAVQREPRRLDNWAQLAASAQREEGANGPVRIIEFGDYQCPACGRAFVTLESTTVHAKTPVDVAFIHFPLSAIHPLAFAASIAAECAANQGKFAEFHRYAYSHQAQLGQQRWTDVAKAAGVVDTVTFTRCLKSGKAAARIEGHAALAAALGIEGTPSFAIDGRLYPPGLPLTVITEMMGSQAP